MYSISNQPMSGAARGQFRILSGSDIRNRRGGISMSRCRMNTNSNSSRCRKRLSDVLVA
jgi:hypothetical protein